MAAQQQLEEVLAQAPDGHAQGEGHGGVEHGGFPLDEAVIVQGEGEGAEDQDQRERDLVHGLQLAVDAVDDGHLRDGRDHEHGGGGVDAVEFVSPEEEEQGEEVEQEFHAGIFSFGALGLGVHGFWWGRRRTGWGTAPHTICCANPNRRVPPNPRTCWWWSMVFNSWGPRDVGSSAWG